MIFFKKRGVKHQDIRNSLISVYSGGCKLCSDVNQASREEGVLFAFKCCFPAGVDQIHGLCSPCLPCEFSTRTFPSILLS